MATPQTLSGLASILSSEPLPQTPMFETLDPRRIANEMEKYVRDLHIYLHRLFGRFTATNIITTINQGGTLPRQIAVIYHYVGDDTGLTVTVDSNFDWREVARLIHVRIADTLENLQHFVDDPDAVTLYDSGSNRSGDYGFFGPPAGDTQFSTDLSVIVGETIAGVLQLQVNNSSGLHREGYIFIGVMAVSRVSSSIVPTSIGNGA